MTTSSYPSVVVLNGAEAGVVLNIDEVLNDFSIGSDEGCHLILSAATVSPMHAALFLDDEGRVTVSDSKSRGGVFVNGTKITEQVLDDGDEISIGPPDDPGSSLLRFSLQGSEAPLVDLSGGDGDSGLVSLEAAPEFDAGLALPESTDALFAPDAAAFEPFAPAEEFPPMEMTAGEPEPESVPEPALEPPPPPPAAPTVAAKPSSGISGTSPAPRRAAPKKSASGDSDDPLAGLAESLGASSSQRFVPPPVAAPAPPKPSVATKILGASPAVMAVRLLIIAAVLIGGSRFAYKKYVDSIVVPVVESYLPNPAEPGQTVTIKGSGFGTDPNPNLVTVALGPVEAHVLDVEANRINITIPESLATSGSLMLPLRVTALGATSTSRLLKIAVAPKITSLTPRVALSGDEVTIAGKWLMNPKNKPVVTVAGTEAEVLEASPNRIRFKVPNVAANEGQRVSVKVATGADVGKEALLNFGRLPFVESITPERALPGDFVTIAGLGLSGPDLAVTAAGRNVVIFSATDSEIKVSAPGMKVSESAGPRDLTVRANGKTSVIHPIEILRDSSAMYSPRFFVEALDDSRVAISCELGPVMVLGADAGSKQRAHDAAVKLNALASQGRNARVQFVAGDVVISAGGTPVLAVGPADGSGNARTMASLWAAHLTDLFDLFLQGRRPSRTVEVSPDGKAYLDIYTAARRRTGEPGVPQGVLMTPDSGWLRSLGALAANPTMGSGQALALMSGYWAGVIEVPGAIQPRRVEISLTATPSGLIGQKTSRQGGLSSDLTLDGLNFSRRELHFSFVDSGEKLNYAGRLDGDVIEGNVTRANGSAVGKLTFKLTR